MALVRPSVHPYLPQELIDAIFDNIGVSLHQEPYRIALRSCLFVSRAFASCSRKHLFRSVEISGFRHRDIFSRTKALHEIISPANEARGERITQYIKTFTVRLDKNQNRSDDLRQLLADILDNLRDENYGITELTLHGIRAPYSGNVGVSWSSLGPVFNSAFVSLCQSPHLRKLRISGVLCLPPTLFDGTHLTDLHLSYITFSYARSLGDARLPRPQLKLFETDSVCPNIFDNLVLEPAFASHIQEMRFVGLHYTQWTENRQRLIAMSGRNIKRLYLTVRSATNQRVLDLDFRVCPNVEYLELDCRPKELLFFKKLPVFCLPNLAVPATFVEHLRIRTQGDCIKTLDKILASGTLPSLSRLSLDLVIGGLYVEIGLVLKKQFEAIKRDGKKCLPSLSPSTSLDINIIDYSDDASDLNA